MAGKVVRQGSDTWPPLIQIMSWEQFREMMHGRYDPFEEVMSAELSKFISVEAGVASAENTPVFKP